jgi:hypothetical protein
MCYYYAVLFLIGAEEVYKSSWYAFQRLQFLWDKDKPAETRSTLSSELMLLPISFTLPSVLTGEITFLEQY